MPDLQRIALIDHIRGLAALSVAWFHLTNGSDGWVRETGRFGYLGVEAFFVISGLVIPYSIIRAFPEYSLRDYPEFIARRIVRLEPPYLVSILVVIIFTLIAAQMPQFRGSAEGLLDPWRIAAHLLYLIPLTEYDWLQPVYWTLAFEFVFYLSIGALFPILAREDQRKEFLGLALLYVAAVAFSALPARVLLFVMGLAAFRHVILGDASRYLYLVCGVCWAVMAYEGAWLEGLVGVGTALLLSNHSKIPPFTPRIEMLLGWLGLVSYSLYLIHVPVGGRFVNLGKRFIENEFGYLVISFLALVVSIAAALVMYRFIEQPAQAYARRLSRGNAS